MSLDVVQARRRLMIMAAIDGVALLAAAAFALGYFAYGIDWMLWLFAAALATGFAAQIWFIAGLRRPDKGV
jgi:hypothetical protein